MARKAISVVQIEVQRTVGVRTGVLNRGWIGPIREDVAKAWERAGICRILSEEDAKWTRFRRAARNKAVQPDADASTSPEGNEITINEGDEAVSPEGSRDDGEESVDEDDPSANE